MAVRPIDGTWSKFVWNLGESESLAKKFREGKACLIDLRLAVEVQPTIIQQNGPLTQADLDVMDYDKVWIDYGDDGECALVVSGRIYALAVLEGAGFEEILQDEVGGETMDRPSGNYTVYRCPPDGI